MDTGEQLETAFTQRREVVGQKALLDLTRHRQLLPQPLLAQHLGMQIDVFQHDGHLQGNRRQHLQVVAGEPRAGTRAVELDDAQPPAIAANQGDAQKRVQLQGRQRHARGEALVALHVFAQDANTVVEGPFHDGAAIGIGRCVGGLPAALAADEKAVVLAE